MGAVMTLFWLAGDRTNNICLPPTTTVDQALRVVARFLKQHPDRTHLGFVELAIAGMAEAWFCQK
jgi:Rap1a immunity proteins